MGWKLKANLRGPQGPQGVQGIPGVNAVPADTAVAAYLRDASTLSHAAIADNDPRIPAYNVSPVNLSKWRAAKAGALNGGAPAKVLIVGDSTSQGAATVAKSWPTALIAALNRRGLATRPGIIAPATNIPDARWAATGAWVKSGTTGPGQGGVWFSPVSPDSLYFASGMAATSVICHYVRQAGGGSCRVVNGAALIGNVVTAGTPTGYASAMITADVSAGDVLTIEGPTGGGVMLLGVETLDTAKPHTVAVSNFAQSGTTTDDWTAGTLSTEAITYVAPNLTIIMLGINDSIGSVTQAAYQARMQTLIVLAQTTGDVIVMTPPRTDPAFASGIGALQASYHAGILVYCRANSIPVIDWYERIGPYAANAWRMDQVHQSDAANQDIALVLADLL